MDENKKYIFQFIILFVATVFLIKLFFIQVVEDEYANLADSNVILREVEYPFRGLIYDRNNELIVYNIPEYDINVVYKQLKGYDPIKLSNVLGWSPEKLEVAMATMKKRKEYSPDKPTLLTGMLSTVDFAKIEDRLDEFNGLYIQAKTSRAYINPSFSNALGYVSEITRKQLRKEDMKIYKQGDYIGQSGLEAFYEPQLRGQRGIHFKLKNVKGIEKGDYKNGIYDTLPIPGKNLVSTIDSNLQQYGEYLMQNKAGSIVAIEPSSGEILAMVSSPSYDPGLLTGKNYSANFAIISANPSKPLFNRPLMAQYRPGSIFKIAQALVALQERVIEPTTRIRCNRSIISCHGGHVNEDLQGALTNSCNPYFYEVFKRMLNQHISEDPYEDARIGLEKWSRYIKSMGFGKRLGIDLFNEKKGLVPTPAYYDEAYHQNKWKFSNIYSLAIGEGENLVVPIQMANFVAILANRGHYYIPHLIKKIGNKGALSRFSQKQYTLIDSTHFELAVDAMRQVVESGTGQYRANLKDIIVCGKTGTVQNTPPPDHSVFIAFAPRDKPLIALSVYVEDAGQGARAAASIASLMIEKYLLGETQRKYIENYVLQGEFLY